MRLCQDVAMHYGYTFEEIGNMTDYQIMCLLSDAGRSDKKLSKKFTLDEYRALKSQGKWPS